MARMPQISEMDFRRLSPFCGARWRTEWAEAILRENLRLSPKTDPWVRRYVLFELAGSQVRTDRQRRAYKRRFPSIFASHSLFHSGGVVRAELEARLLADESHAIIGEKTGIPPEHIEAYAALFFDVSGRLHAKDWLLDQVLGFPLFDGRVRQSGFIRRGLMGSAS